MPVIARVLRLASRLACLVVLAAFVIFAVHQTSAGATNELGKFTRTAKAAEERPSGLHQLIDEAANGLSSPFEAITSGIDSQWGVHIVDLLLALLLYGFICGFIARIISLRL